MIGDFPSAGTIDIQLGSERNRCLCLKIESPLGEGRLGAAAGPGTGFEVLRERGFDFTPFGVISS
jgi:hypothetical protein